MADTRNTRLTESSYSPLQPPSPLGGAMNGSYPAQQFGRPMQATAGSFNMQQPSFGGQPPSAMLGQPPQQPFGAIGQFSPTFGAAGPMLNSMAPGGTPQGPIQGAYGAPPGYQPPGIQTIDKDPITGKLLSIPTMPGDIGQFRGGIINYLGRNTGGLNPGSPMQLGQQFGQGLPGLDRGQIRDVNGMPVSDVGTGTQSADQLVNSGFFQNYANQLSPLFGQQLNDALAQAKESAGSLTGSGFANALGGAVNRVLPQQQALLANFANQGVAQELARQGQQAELAQGRNTLGAQLGQQANLANQSADQQFINQLLQRGQLGLQGEQLGLQQGMANQGAQQAYDLSRANNLAGLIGQFGNTGVGPNQLAFSGGIGQLAGPAGQLIGQLLAQRGSGAGGAGGGSAAGDIIKAITGGGGAGGMLSTGSTIKDVLGSIGGLAGAAGDKLGLGGLTKALGNIPGASGVLGSGALGSLLGGSPIGLGLGALQSLGLFGQNKKTGLNQVVSAISNPVGTAAGLGKKAGSWIKKHLFSDERLKEDFVPLGNGLYNFAWKGDGSRDVGFVAQEVQRVLPSAVTRDKTGFLKVDYSRAPEILKALEDE